MQRKYRKADIESYTTDDNLTIVLMDSDVYILDTIATIIYNSCMGVSLNEIVARVQEQCIQLPDLQTLQKDIANALSEMIEKKLLIYNE